MGSAVDRSELRAVKSAVRTLEILEFFDEVQRPANVVTVSEALGYPQSSTSALLRSLVAMGYLQLDRRSRTYTPTDRVSLLGSWINPPLFAEASLPRLLRAIKARTGLMVLLAAKNGGYSQCYHVLNKPAPVEKLIRIGLNRPLATAIAGRVLLSMMPEAEIKRLYHRLNAYAARSEEVVNVRELLESLKEIRRAGYLCDVSPGAEGRGLIAVPLPGEATGRPLVIGLGGPYADLKSREAEYVSIIREEIAIHLPDKAKQLDAGEIFSSGQGVRDNAA
jgi:DNA-binding IclR family transcriptional regulator